MNNQIHNGIVTYQFFFSTGIGVFQAYYQTHQLQDISPSTVSWITSLEVFNMFAGVCVVLGGSGGSTLYTKAMLKSRTGTNLGQSI